MFDLAQRAEEFEHIVESSLVDRNGLLLSLIDSDTMKPFPSGYFDAGKDYYTYPGANYGDFSNWLNYENVGMVTGAYLAAMAWKYRATKSPEALDRAYRCFKGIKHLFDMCQSVEEGFFCKCYGEKVTDQISSDQYIYAFIGLDEFMPFAAHREKAQCVEMISKMAGFWIRKNYAYPYFGIPFNWPLERFPAFSWLAHHHTGKKELLDEFNRLRDNNTVRDMLPFWWHPRTKTGDSGVDWRTYIGSLVEGPLEGIEKKFGKHLIHLNPENTQSGLLSLEPMLKYNAPERKLWMDKAWQLFDFGKRWIADDGMAYGYQLYDKASGEFTELREFVSAGKSQEQVVGWLRNPMGAAMFARAAVSIEGYFPGKGAFDIARKILAGLDREKLRWRYDMDGKQFTGRLAWARNLFSGDAVTNWLWAYWEGRAQSERGGI